MVLTPFRPPMSALVYSTIRWFTAISYFRHLCNLDFWNLQGFLWVVWCHRPPCSTVDKLKLIGVNTMSKFEGNYIWCLGIRLSGPRSRVVP